MSEWQSLRIGQHVTIIPGFPFDSQRFDDEEGVPLVRIRDLLAGMTETKFNGKYDPIYLIGPGDILIGMDGDFNIARWKGGTALLNQRMLKIADKKFGEIDCMFLFYVLGPLLKGINNKTSATTVKHLSTYDILDAFIPAPPLPQQRKIARILTTVDNLIEKTEALIAKYQAMKQGMMHDLFTRGVDEHGHLRPPYEEAPELYKESELGWIPKEWEASLLGDYLVSIDAGWSPDCIEQPPALGEWGVLKVSAVTSGEYVAAESKTLPSHLHPNVSMEVRAGDVLLARSNGVAELVGVTVRVEETREKLMLSDKVLRLNPDRRRLSQAFLALTMKTELIRRLVGQVINGSSGQRNISQTHIRKLAIVVPPLEEQQSISSRLHSTQLQVHREMNAVAHLRQVKTGLMQDLLTGKVRVTVDETEEVASV